MLQHNNITIPLKYQKEEKRIIFNITNLLHNFSPKIFVINVSAKEK